MNEKIKNFSVTTATTIASAYKGESECELTYELRKAVAQLRAAMGCGAIARHRGIPMGIKGLVFIEGAALVEAEGPDGSLWYADANSAWKAE